MHISGDEDSITCLQRLVNSSEDAVGLEVLAPPGPPPLNNTIVVAVDFDSGERTKFEDCADK